ncbi:hypothetical protein CVT24_004819 [Panaeolus cyanescens]|uniref:Uncharacterized protein n=1 Tax=Panaeolus cyanescens TaxID=181874 RepID=A0A409VQ29_9AGAR|nr:hypothetical protein CVT24_004819 [Panaeolus cyanescens]
MNVQLRALVLTAVFLRALVAAQTFEDVQINANPPAPSSPSVGESDTLIAAAPSASPQTTTISQPPIVPTNFTAFPVPSDTPNPPGYFSTNPSKPPDVGSTAIPDFGPAWKAALEKAKKKVGQTALRISVVLRYADDAR